MDTTCGASIPLWADHSINALGSVTALASLTSLHLHVTNDSSLEGILHFQLSEWLWTGPDSQVVFTSSQSLGIGEPQGWSGINPTPVTGNVPEHTRVDANYKAALILWLQDTGKVYGSKKGKKPMMMLSTCLPLTPSTRQVASARPSA